MIKEIYYWMIYYLKKVKINDRAEFNSYLLLCAFLFANVATIVVTVGFLLGFTFEEFSEDYKTLGIILGVSLMIINYFLLFLNNDEIYAKYDKLSHHRKIKGIILFWIYSIVSIPLFFILVANLTR